MVDHRGSDGPLEPAERGVPEGPQGSDPRPPSRAGRLSGDRLTPIGRRRSSVTGIVLAAGTSSRMGRPKQLLDLGGKPVLRHVVDAALAAPLDEVLVVLGHAAEQVEAVISGLHRIRFVLNPDFAQGQSTSMRAGLRATPASAGAAVFLLGDQPGARRDAIAAVVEAWRAGAGPVVQASYAGRPAHPTLVDREVWPELEAVSGDEGARSVIARDRRRRALVEVEGSPPEDIDTEEDYNRARARFSN